MSDGDASLGGTATTFEDDSGPESAFSALVPASTPPGAARHVDCANADTRLGPPLPREGSPSTRSFAVPSLPAVGSFPTATDAETPRHRGGSS